MSYVIKIELKAKREKYTSKRQVNISRFEKNVEKKLLKIHGNLDVIKEKDKYNLCDETLTFDVVFNAPSYDEANKLLDVHKKEFKSYVHEYEIITKEEHDNRTRLKEVNSYKPLNSGWSFFDTPYIHERAFSFFDENVAQNITTEGREILKENLDKVINHLKEYKDNVDIEINTETGFGKTGFLNEKIKEMMDNNQVEIIDLGARGISDAMDELVQTEGDSVTFMDGISMAEHIDVCDTTLNTYEVDTVLDACQKKHEEGKQVVSALHGIMNKALEKMREVKDPHGVSPVDVANETSDEEENFYKNNLTDKE